jgi:hypothetical protein
MTAREIDIHTLPSMLTALRLPSFHKLWAEIATRADNEGWPAARFLAVLAEYELAERDMRRIRRHLNEAQLPAGKTLATFDFKALPTLPRARIEALAAGDWLDGGGNLIAIGNSGTGKTHIHPRPACAAVHTACAAPGRSPPRCAQYGWAGSPSGRPRRSSRPMVEALRPSNAPIAPRLAPRQCSARITPRSSPLRCLYRLSIATSYALRAVGVALETCA